MKKEKKRREEEEKEKEQENNNVVKYELRQNLCLSSIFPHRSITRAHILRCVSAQPQKH